MLAHPFKMPSTNSTYPVCYDTFGWAVGKSSHVSCTNSAPTVHGVASVKATSV